MAADFMQDPHGLVKHYRPGELPVKTKSGYSRQPGKRCMESLDDES